MDKNKPYVFISYRSTDKEVACETKSILKQNGIESWMAPESIPAGSDYGTEIPKALKECSAFVILLSKDAQQSRWIPKEIDGAINNGKIIIPFRIDDCDILDSFDFRLCDSQRIEAYNRMSEAYDELVECLKALVITKENEKEESIEIIGDLRSIDKIGRIVIPMWVRKLTSIQEDDFIEFEIINRENILLKKVEYSGENVRQIDMFGRITFPKNIKESLNMSYDKKIAISVTRQMDTFLIFLKII